MPLTSSGSQGVVPGSAPSRRTRGLPTSSVKPGANPRIPNIVMIMTVEGISPQPEGFARFY